MAGTLSLYRFHSSEGCLPIPPSSEWYVRASECPDVKNYTWRLNPPVWHSMLYSCTQQWASKG